MRVRSVAEKKPGHVVELGFTLRICADECCRYPSTTYGRPKLEYIRTCCQVGEANGYSLCSKRSGVANTCSPSAHRCPRISFLVVLSCSLIDGIPSTFGNLAGIYELDLSFNRLTGRPGVGRAFIERVGGFRGIAIMLGRSLSITWLR